MSAGQTPMFNSQRGVPFLPQAMRDKTVVRGEGFHAFEERKRREESLAYDDSLTAQERFNRYHSMSPDEQVEYDQRRVRSHRRG